MCLFFSPLRNDPKKKTHKLHFGTHPVPGQSHKFVYVYVFCPRKLKQTRNSFAILWLQVSRDMKSIAAGPLRFFFSANAAFYVCDVSPLRQSRGTAEPLSRGPLRSRDDSCRHRKSSIACSAIKGKPCPSFPWFLDFIKEKPQIYQGSFAPTEPTKSLENIEKTRI